MDFAIAFLLTTMTAATPVLLAALGELVTERSGVLNLGVEGMMVMGAAVAFVATQVTGLPYVGALSGVLAGAAFSLLFAFVTLTLGANQVASGLSLTIFGIGVSGMIGTNYVGIPGIELPAIPIPGLVRLPFVGPLLFNHSVIFYISILLVIGVSWFLFRTRAGLQLRSIGDNHDSAHAQGMPVIRVRYLAVMFGGACAGLGGAQLSLVYTPQWADHMTAGRGWIALALVVFATWRPVYVLVGAYLFGIISIAQFNAQALGVPVPTQFLSSLPYLATILVLVLISRNRRLTTINTPACLGQPFVPER